LLPPSKRLPEARDNDVTESRLRTRTYMLQILKCRYVTKLRLWVRSAPAIDKLTVCVPPTAAARAVSCCHCCRLIEEKKLGVPARGHENSLSTIERPVVIQLPWTCPYDVKLARQPHLPLCVTNYVLVIIVQAAAVAEHGGRRAVSHAVRDDLAPWRHAVLQRS
jgi:hypothetical protein